MQKVELNLANYDNYFVTEAFRTLRTNLQFCGIENKVVVLTSCDESEGKTTVSLMLARSLAEANKKVVYLDCDLRRSVVAVKFAGNRHANGLSEYLSGLVEVDNIIYSTQYTDFDVIFSGPYCPNPVELMMAERFKTLITKLRSEYDYVIVDTPPLGLVIDGAVVAKYCDAAALVISAGRIKYKQARNIKNQLEKSGCKMLGVVLNHSDKRGERSYRKYYKKYYGKGYYGHPVEQEAD